MKKNLVTIVISTYNNRSTIDKCLKSILAQTYDNIETIVIDEWSADGTSEIAKSYNAKVFFYGKERANNRNFGIKKSQGQYILVLDSDMKLKKNVVKECIELSRKGFEAIVVPEKSIGEGFWAKVRAFERSFYKGDDAVEAARFFRKDIIKKIGGYDPSIVGAEDWDLHQRIMKNDFKIGRIDSYIVHNEGRLTLRRLLKKKVYYGKAFLEYKKRHPGAFRKAVIRGSLFSAWRQILLKPKYGIAIVVLKLLEGGSLFFGMILARLGYNFKHY
ncbi:glycosyltransferase [Patescibacteria group bacterium]|nr:glycosyltransferase [Patescibacteria group bacterium]